MLKLKGALYEQQLIECLDVTVASAMEGPHPERLRLFEAGDDQWLYQ